MTVPFCIPTSNMLIFQIQILQILINISSCYLVPFSHSYRCVMITNCDFNVHFLFFFLSPSSSDSRHPTPFTKKKQNKKTVACFISLEKSVWRIISCSYEENIHHSLNEGEGNGGRGEVRVYCVGLALSLMLFSPEVIANSLWCHGL